MNPTVANPLYQYLPFLALLAPVAMFWGQVKVLIGKLFSVFVVKVEFNEHGYTVFNGYLNRNFQRYRLGQSIYDAFTDYTTVDKRTLTIGYEENATLPQIYRKGRTILFVKKTVTKERPDSLSVYFLRGTFNAELHYVTALKEHNGARMPSRSYRVFIRYGSSGRTILREGNSPNGDKGITDNSGARHLSNRLLGYTPDQIGYRDKTNITTGYVFSQDAQVIVDKCKRWRASENWYKERGILWTMGCILVGSPGTGKCLAKGTKVLMFDGAIKVAEDILVGDKIMGPDSKPKTILSLANGFDTMYEVKPIKGEPYTVNSEHILSLRMSRKASLNGKYLKGGEVVNLSIDDYLKSSTSFKHAAKGWRTGVNFSSNEIPLDPYFLGAWLGDGTSDDTSITTADPEIKEWIYNFAAQNKMKVTVFQPEPMDCPTYLITTGKYKGHGKNFNPIRNKLRELNVFANKHIPEIYKVNSREVRLQILAGLLDTDGSYFDSFDITTKHEKLADDICFLGRSLGFAVYKKDSYKRCMNCKDTSHRKYYRISISGNIDEIPTKLPRKQATKRKQIKNVLNTGISVKEVGHGEYFGFEVDGDGLFLLGDFTVTHNTSLVRKICQTLDIPLFVFDLGSMSNAEMIENWKEMQAYAPCAVIFDDIERTFEGSHNVAKNGGGLTLDCLLGCLSGAIPCEGVLKFATANAPEKLDPALGIIENGKPSRPGRFDMIVTLGEMTAQDRKALAAMILKGLDVNLDEIVAKGEGMMAAQFNDYCTNLAVGLYWAREEAIVEAGEHPLALTEIAIVKTREAVRAKEAYALRREIAGLYS